MDPQRKFPYHSAVPSFSLPDGRRAEGGVNAGQAADPGRKVFEQPGYILDNFGQPMKHEGTDFMRWSPEQIKARCWASCQGRIGYEEWWKAACASLHWPQRMQ